MEYRLITLSNGHLCLEFEEVDLPKVVGTIVELFGTPAVRKEILCELWAFAGGEFMYYREWDPCLVALSVDSNEVLQNLHSTLRNRL